LYNFKSEFIIIYKLRYRFDVDPFECLLGHTNIQIVSIRWGRTTALCFTNRANQLTNRPSKRTNWALWARRVTRSKQ